MDREVSAHRNRGRGGRDFCGICPFFLTPDTDPAESPGPLIDRILAASQDLLNLPYVFGGRDVARQGGLDCAGFVMVVYHRLGVNLTNHADYDTGLWLTNAQRLYDGDTIQTPITRTDDPQPGDLVFFENTYDTGGDQISHVAIVVSPGRMVGAQGAAAGYVDFGASPYWLEHLVGYGHVELGSAPATTASPWTTEEIAAATGCPADAVAENWPKVLAALESVGQASRASLACAAATAAIESATTFKPVREAFWLSEAWRAANLRYYPWYGRGLIQLTWEDSYKAYGERLGIDLIGNPDLALDPDNAARIYAAYWVDRDIQSMADRGDWAAVRKAVQGGDDGLDRLVSIVSTLLS